MTLHIYTPSHSRATRAQNWTVLTDFDGTISRYDVTDALLEHFALPGADALEQAWESGAIGSRECLQGQIALLRATPAELDALLDQVPVDPYFAEFVESCNMRQMSVRVVSDGLDYGIARILKRHGLGHLGIAANHLRYQGNRRWSLEFPFANPDCAKASGNCKCARLDQRRQLGQNVLYIGDGSSDFCVSRDAQWVFAKDRLLDYCHEHGLPHQAMPDFREAIALLDAWMPLRHVQGALA